MIVSYNYCAILKLTAVVLLLVVRFFVKPWQTQRSHYAWNKQNLAELCRSRQYKMQRLRGFSFQTYEIVMVKKLIMVRGVLSRPDRATVVEDDSHDSSWERMLLSSFVLRNETSTLSFLGTNVHCVVVSFPGTKVHRNETSRYQL